MRLKYRVSLAVISILMVMTLFLSSSYALWSVTVAQESENLIKSGCFEIAIEDEKDSKPIDLQNTYPMSDDKGMKLAPYKFTVKNTCTVDAKYTLYLSELATNGAKATEVKKNLSDYIKVALTKGENESVITTQKLSETKTNTNEKNLVKVSGVQGLSFEGKTIKNTYLLTTGELKGKTSDQTTGGEDTFTLHLWISSDADNDVMKQTFEAGVSAIAYATDLSASTESVQES